MDWSDIRRLHLRKMQSAFLLPARNMEHRFSETVQVQVGVLEHPGVIKNPERVRDAWQRAYGGRNAHKVAVLEEGMKFTPIAIPNNEAQFLETRKFQIEEIARMYRVPLHMIGDLDHATFSVT